jgi:hypothetical protein
MSTQIIDPEPDISNGETAVCPVCGVTFEQWPSWYHTQKVYCSPAHRKLADNRRVRERKRHRANINAVMRLIAEKEGSDGTQTVSIDFDGGVIYHQTYWLGADLPNHQWVEARQYKN